MKLLSWNVNGIRAAVRKGFDEWLAGSDADVIGLQEVRALPEQIPASVRKAEGWHKHFQPAERKGYSGVGLLSRHPFELVTTELGVAEQDCEGRLQVVELGDLLVANGYFPNGSGKGRDNSRVPFKLEFYQLLFEQLQSDMQAGRPIVVMGDFNTAHRPIDLARPKQNEQTSGFLPEERDELDRWLEAGWIDTFRYFHPEARDRYTWWSQRGNVRERNVGWRIDYMLASPGAEALLRHADIHPDVMGSDHCPISLELDYTL